MIKQQDRYVRIRGFTLIEMSIVLGIIAFIASAVVGGNALMRSAELRSVQVDVERYERAILQFRDRHGALPGDFADATRIWGARDGGDGVGNDCINAASIDSLTCNGNGSGRIAEQSNANDDYEMFRMWQHLTNDGFIEEQFTGVKSDASDNSTAIAVNVPSSKYRDGATGFSLEFKETDSNHFPLSLNNHLLMFGSDRPNDVNRNPSISSRNAWELDNKIDDGRPGTGRVVTYDNGQNSSCATSDDVTTATYNRMDGDDIIACVLHFKMQF